MKTYIGVLGPVRNRGLRSGKLTILTALLLVLTVSCTKVEPIPEPSPVAVSSVKLNKTSATLSVGEILELTATITPDDATDKSVKWTSSDTDVATVTDGKVTAVAAGSATITAQAGNVKAECTITVSPVEVTSISLNKTSATLSVGEILELTATITPDDATDKSVKWTSSDTDVATVTDGKVTAVAAGSATITAQAGNVKAECTITVSPVEVTSISLNRTSATLSVGEILELTATITPDDATDKTVKWTSSDTDVATVTDGKVTAVATGSATITAYSNNGYSDTCRIVVVSRPDAGGSEGTGEVEW